MDEKEILDVGEGYYWAKIRCRYEDSIKGIYLIFISINKITDDIYINIWRTASDRTYEPEEVEEVIEEVKKPELDTSEDKNR